MDHVAGALAITVVCLTTACASLQEAARTQGWGNRTEPSRHEELANLPFPEGYPTAGARAALKDELLFERAVQSYLWAQPALNMYGMKEGSEKTFGAGYNVLPVFKERLNAKTLITTPNSDVIYALGYLDLLDDGPMVIEVPPGLQGILDDYFQRPICSEGPIDGKTWCGDVGLPGPDKGKGGNYLILPPDYHAKVPPEYFALRSRTYGVFVFWRAFFRDPQQLDAPVKLIEQTRIYPLGRQAEAKPMQFPDASKTPVNMLYPIDGSAFDMLARFVEREYVDPADADMRGMLASIGIVKGQPFNPDAHTREILDNAARTAYRMGRVMAYEPSPLVPNARYYPDRQWTNAFPGNAEFSGPSFTYLDIRAGFFALACSASPGMAVSMVNAGAKYPATFTDADGDYLSGGKAYQLDLPPGIPASIFWSVTAYDPENASGLDNGQPFPSINTMDKPPTNPDGSIRIYFGPDSPGNGKNWIRTVPGKGFFVILRLYGPTQAFFDRTWKPGDIEKVKQANGKRSE